MAELRTYDVHSANEALPRVRSLVARIVELTDLLPELQDQVRIAEYKKNRPGGGGDDGASFAAAVTRLRESEDAMEATLSGLEDLSVALKDARLGLVDFYGYREGELVELCWRLGENSVAHWHRIGEGFRGRKPL